MKSQPKHPWYKKVTVKNLKKVLMGNQNGQPKPPELKFLIMLTRPQNFTAACQLLKVSDRQQ